MNRFSLVLVTLLIGFLATTANATAIFCETTTLNHMSMDNTQVTACVDAGLGNINQNTLTDVFLTSGGTLAGYVGAGVGSSFTTGGTDPFTTGATEFGTWTINSAVDAIGFKFGTGNTADEWFIYDLVSGTTTGNWAFFDILAPGFGGNRLSNIQTYNKSVPESSTLVLMGFGLLIVGFNRRKRLH